MSSTDSPFLQKSKENIATDGTLISTDSKSGSMKKQKRRNISGLAKVSLFNIFGFNLMHLF